MLTFKERFPRKGVRLEKGSRSRIIGESDGKRLLYCVNNSKQTSIEVVSPDGSSMTALSFNEYADIINADLSFDNELIHLTRRIASQKGFAFSSIVYDIHSAAKSKEIQSDLPIQAFFTNDSVSPNYEMLHVIGNKIRQMKVVSSKKRIEIEKMRGGISIPGVISWTYHRNNGHLIIIHDVKGQNIISDYNMKNVKQTIANPAPVNIHPQSKLPKELSLNPLSTLHLPFFRCKNNRIFATRYNSKICVIQQLFENIDSNLKYCINIYPRIYSTIITVPNVQSDIPINVLQFGSLIFVFVVNKFIGIIDIARNPPFISLQMNAFSSGPCGDCSAALPLHPHIVDLNTGDVYSVRPSLVNAGGFSRIMDRPKYDLMALICSRLQEADSFAAVLQLVCNGGDPFVALRLARRLFFYLSGDESQFDVKLKRLNSIGSPQRVPLLQREPARAESLRFKSISDSIRVRLNEIETEFPSASSVPRKRVFRSLVRMQMNRPKGRRLEDAAKKALLRLEQQNSASLFIRSGLDAWVRDFSPSPFWQFIVLFSILNETIFADFPAVLVLRDETESLFQSLGSGAMYRTLRHSGVFGAPHRAPSAAKEVQYWRERLPETDGDTSSSTSKSSLVFSLQRASSGITSLDASDFGAMSVSIVTHNGNA